MKLPAGMASLDPLQAEGALSLLHRLLDPLDGTESIKGEHVAVSSHWVGAHPDGALVLLVVQAETLTVAETAARELMLEVLEDSELLTDWQIVSCEVSFDERFAEAGLRAADGPDAPPADPAERARWQARQGMPSSTPARQGGDVDWQQWMTEHAALVKAFDTATFDIGDGGDQTARLAAGALVFAASLVIDELLQDISTLHEEEMGSVPVADSNGVFCVLDELPERFAQHYNGRFARQFLVATIMITNRLADHEWLPPASVGEALALHLVVERARDFLVGKQLIDEETAQRIYAGFESVAFTDLDHEWLYERELDGFEDDAEFTAQFGPVNLHVESWFQQIPSLLGHVHPFSVEIPPPPAGKPPASPTA